MTRRSVGNGAIREGLIFFRKNWLLILQGALSVFLLWRIFDDATLRSEAMHLMGAADRFWLVAGLCAALLSELFCAARWWIMLNIFGVPIGFTRCCAFTGAGLFYSLTLPGAGGGDAFRILYVVRLHPTKKLRVAMSVIADRLCGMIALVLALGITFLHRHNFPLDTHARSILEASLVVLGAMILFVFFWYLTTLPFLRAKSLKLLPAVIRSQVLELGDNFWKIVEHPRKVAIGVAFSCAALAAHFTTYFCSGQSVRLPVTIGQMFTVMPVIDALIILPVTLYGVGLREMLFEHLLAGMYGVPRGAATITSMCGFGLQALIGLLGGLLIPFTVPRTRRDETIDS